MNDKTDMIVEMISAVGQELSDKMDSNNKQKWNPEANRYSRSLSPKTVSNLMRNHLKHSDLILLLEMVFLMDSNNIITEKSVKGMGFPRSTLHLSKTNLIDKGCIFEYDNGLIMVNPKIAMLTKYRKDCLALQSKWTKQMKEASLVTQEIEQDQTLFD